MTEFVMFSHLSLCFSQTLSFTWYGLMEVSDKASWKDQLQQYHLLTV